MVPFARGLGELSVGSNRLLACRLLGTLSKHIDGPSIENTYLRLIVEVCCMVIVGSSTKKSPLAIPATNANSLGYAMAMMGPKSHGFYW